MSLTGKPQNEMNRSLAVDGFWPALLVGDFLDEWRIPSEYSEATVVAHLRVAIVEAITALRPAKDAAIAAGNNTLAAFAAANSEPVDGIETLVLLWQTAVFALAKAKALRQFATINRRPVAENEAKSAPETEDYYLDEHQRAVAAILSRMVPAAVASPTNYGVYAAAL